jgi:hypothetical protein
MDRLKHIVKPTEVNLDKDRSCKRQSFDVLGRIVFVKDENGKRGQVDSRPRQGELENLVPTSVIHTGSDSR